MNGERVKEYYAKGMTLNHRLMCALRPDFEQSVSRVYTHQASPALVADFRRDQSCRCTKRRRIARAR